MKIKLLQQVQYLVRNFLTWA